MLKVRMLKRWSPLVLLAALLVAASPLPAPAGAPGTWTGINALEVGATTEFGLARTADGVLHVIWVEDDNTNWNLMHRSIQPKGAVSAPASVISGWGFMDPIPDLIATSDGGLRAFVGGAPPSVAGGLWTTASSDGGQTWTAPVNVNNRTFWGGSTTAVESADGSFFQATSSLLHKGLTSSTPDFDFGPQYGGACCYTNTKLATDDASDEIWLALYAWGDSPSSPPVVNGVYVQQVDPADGSPLGDFMQMPGSSVEFDGQQASSDPGGRLPLVGRAGGGMYTAFNAGYPSVTKVLVWRVGAPSSQVIANIPASLEDSAIELAAAPDGRMWVLWGVEGTPAKIFASISNTSGTGWSTPAEVKLPIPSPGNGDIFTIQADASATRLDVLTMIGSVPVSGLFHTQLDVPPPWTAGDDSLAGGGGADYMYGGPGNDRLLGKGGKDQIYGGAGRDRIDGGKGKDFLIGGAGKDICFITTGDKTKSCESKRRGHL